MEGQHPRERIWFLFQRWLAPLIGFAIAGAVLFVTGREWWPMLVVDGVLLVVMGYLLMAAVLAAKALIAGYDRRQYVAELRNFLVPGGHCFAWTTASIIGWIPAALILKWGAFDLVAGWFGRNPWNPRAGGFGGALTGALVGCAVGLGQAVLAAFREGRPDASRE